MKIEKSKDNICFCGYTVIVPEERALDARQMWNDFDENESEFAIFDAFRGEEFEVIDDREIE